MPKAVAGKNIIAIRFFLIDTLSDLFNSKYLLTFEREIHNMASSRFTKNVFNVLHFAQTHRQKGFDRLPLDGLTTHATDRAGIRGAGWALKFLRGQFTNGISCFGWTTTRVSH
jgi:hypothetical protein